MARGWESKSVEQQQEESRADSAKKRTPLLPDQIAQQRRRQTLELSRKRILQQIETASNPQHLQMLHAALKDLEAQLAKSRS